MNKMHLVIILAMLVLVRFVVLPVIEWQTSQIDQNTQLAKRLQKTDALVENTAYYQAQLPVLHEMNETVSLHYHSLSNQTSIQIQRLIETIFEEQQVQLTSFDWLLQGGDDNSQYIADIAFTGTGYDVVKLQKYFATNSPKLIVSSFRLQKRRSGGLLLDELNGAMTLVVFAKAKSEGADE